MCKKPFACVSGARPYVSMWCKQIVYKSLHYKDRTSAPVGFIPANTTVRCTTMIFQTFFRRTLCVALILASKSFGERSYLGVSKGLWLSLKIFSCKEFFFSHVKKQKSLCNNCFLASLFHESIHVVHSFGNKFSLWKEKIGREKKFIFFAGEFERERLPAPPTLSGNLLRTVVLLHSFVHLFYHNPYFFVVSRLSMI